MKIISLAPSNTEILYALGADNLIMANTWYCDFPEHSKRKPKVGGWLNIDDELVKKYNPDVVMTSTFVQDKIVQQYNDLGIQVFHTDPKTLDDIVR